MKQVIFAFVLVLGFGLAAFGQAKNQLCTKTPGTGGVVEAGQLMRFVAAVSGKTDNLTLAYEWKVSAGKIVDGQGTCAILIDTTGLADGTNITAEVTVKGFPECCPNTASETGSVVVTRKMGRNFDEFGRLANDDMRARLDAFFVELGNDPAARGYIINYGTDKEIAARERLIRNHAAMRKFDVTRITFARGEAGAQPSEPIRTRIWIVPPGAEFPTP